MLDSWNIHLKENEIRGQVLSPKDIFKADESPGLYVWYGILNLGNADISERKNVINALKRQNSRFKTPPLDSTVKGNLGSFWSGQLLDQSMDRLMSALSESEEIAREKSAIRLNRTIEHEPTRKLLCSLLDMCTPIFSSPLYIGISDNLRRRLTIHVQKFRVLSEYKSIKLKDQLFNIDAEEDDATSGINFAARAVIAGFKEDNLKVYTFPLDKNDCLSDEEIFDLIAAIEFLLNRWSRPILGGK